MKQNDWPVRMLFALQVLVIEFNTGKSIFFLVQVRDKAKLSDLTGKNKPN